MSRLCSIGLLALLLAMFPLRDARTADTDSAEPPLKISLHYLDGLSTTSGSAPHDIRFLRTGCQLTMLVTNVSEKDVHLWRPWCPMGDDAIVLEFKGPGGDNKVAAAKITRFYTAGSGNPRIIRLVAGDTLVCRIDLSREWTLPFALADGKVALASCRAVYESGPLPANFTFRPDNTEKVWQGRVETAWQPVRISNVSGKEIPLPLLRGKELVASQ